MTGQERKTLGFIKEIMRSAGTCKTAAAMIRQNVSPNLTPYDYLNMSAVVSLWCSAYLDGWMGNDSTRSLKAVNIIKSDRFMGKVLHDAFLDVAHELEEGKKRTKTDDELRDEILDVASRVK